jgi:UDP-N-acetylmuramoylalanine--D-glutamate ligase
VAVTSLHPDHLDWHAGDPDTYFRDKLSLCTQPGADATVANGTSARLRDNAACLGPRVVWATMPEPAGSDWTAPLGLRGAHNRLNAEIARLTLREFGVVAAADLDALRDAAAGFTPLASRLHSLGSVEGVEFVDDSLSTNVLPTLAALDAFAAERVALIVGGFDRGIDYTPLAEGLAARGSPTLVLAIPDSGHRIRRTLDACDTTAPVEIVECDDLAEAVGTGFAWAKPEGVVLLSPAAPSFGRFRDYRDRAAAFAAAAGACGTLR